MSPAALAGDAITLRALTRAADLLHEQARHAPEFTAIAEVLSSSLAQAEDAAGNGKSKIAKRFAKHHATIFRTRCGEHRITLIRHPIECAAINNETANRIAVAAQKLCRGMHDNVGAMFEGAHEIGRGECVVDDQRHAGALGNF